MTPTSTDLWTAIRPDGRTDYAPLLAAMPERTADYTLTNLWGWADIYGLRWRTAHGMRWICQTGTPPGTSSGTALFAPGAVYWAPVGDWLAADWVTMPELVPGTTLIRVPESLCALLQDRLPGRVTVEETPDQWEYVYPREQLATLRGNLLHKKRNHVNAYLKLYGEDYHRLTPAMIPDALALEAAWLTTRPDTSAGEPSALLAADPLHEESLVCCRVLRHWEQLPDLYGGALYAQERMIAFCVAEPLAPDMAVVHFEKALPEYRGAYQAINWCFARDMEGLCTRINREQDGGNPGLRQAKRSYLPFEQIRKHTVRITG